CFLYFRCSHDLRHLPSFPTRRSSDLTFWISLPVFRSKFRSLTTMLPVTPAFELTPPFAVTDPVRFRTSPVTSLLSTARYFPSGRSEEHTSELQSQSNLVCRLLLEKKN